jgi:malate dehydrogenase (oxaloacetate-decarboxylating)(NADP+)
MENINLIHFFPKVLFILLQGLIVSSRANSLQHFKKPWAHEHEPVGTLIEAVKVLK